LFLACIATLSAQNDQRQVAMGAQLAKTFQSQVTQLDCPIALQFINALGDRIAPQLTGDLPSYQFTLIADDNGDPAHEPYPLPGGYIFVPAKLILTAQSEAEVARMLARSMAHGFPPLKGGSMPLTWIPSYFDRSRTLLLPTAFQAQQDEIVRDADRDARIAIAAAGYNLSQNEPPSAAFLTIQRELQRLLPERKPPSLQRKPPTLLR
jgi:hypothetical protein